MTDSGIKGDIPTQGANAQGKTTPAGVSHFGGPTKFEFNAIPAGGTYTAVNMQLGKTETFFRQWCTVQYTAALTGLPWRYTDETGHIYTGVFVTGNVELT